MRLIAGLMSKHAAGICMSVHVIRHEQVCAVTFFPSEKGM